MRECEFSTMAKAPTKLIDFYIEQIVIVWLGEETEKSKHDG